MTLLFGGDGAAEKFSLGPEIIVGHASDKITDNACRLGLGQPMGIEVMGEIANDY